MLADMVDLVWKNAINNQWAVWRRESISSESEWCTDFSIKAPALCCLSITPFGVLCIFNLRLWSWKHTKAGALVCCSSSCLWKGWSLSPVAGTVESLYWIKEPLTRCSNTHTSILTRSWHTVTLLLLFSTAVYTAGELKRKREVE